MSRRTPLQRVIQGLSGPDQHQSLEFTPAANDNLGPLHPGGGASGIVLPHQSGIRAVTLVARAQVRDALIEQAEEIASLVDAKDPYKLLTGARQIKRVLVSIAPALTDALRKLKAGRLDLVYVSGLEGGSLEARKLIAIALNSFLGHAFNFSGQNNGELCMELAPKPGAAANSNDTANEFEPHTDDAIVLRSMRPHHICLFGVHNPGNTATAYAPLSWALARLTNTQRAILQEHRFKVRVPRSFSIGEALWRANIPVVYWNKGRVECQFPSYNCEPVDAADTEAQDALDALLEALKASEIQLAVNPGCFLAFSNLRGTHSRRKIEPGKRLILRTYAVDSLAALRRQTGETGPIFTIGSVLSDLLDD